MAYVMLMDHHVLPHEYNALPGSVKAFLIAAYRKRSEDQEEANRKLEAARK